MNGVSLFVNGRQVTQSAWGHDVEVVTRPSSEKRKARESQRPMFGGPESVIGERVQKDLDYYFLGDILNRSE